MSEPTRTAHLESLIGRYLGNPGHSRISPERSSRAAYGAPPGSLGDYDPSVHLQGELVGAMLDLIIRDATGNRRSMDDVMRLMLARFSGERGFVGRDVERVVAEVCACEVRSFFDAHVRGATPIDFDRYVRLAGLTARVSWAPSLNRDGTPAVDLRLFGWQEANDSSLRLLLTDPTSAWGRGGLHTGDRLMTMNGTPMRTVGEFRALMRRLRIGDTVRVEVVRPTGPWRTNVVVAGFDRPVVRVEERSDATPRQRALRARWLAGEP